MKGIVEEEGSAELIVWKHSRLGSSLVAVLFQILKLVMASNCFFCHHVGLQLSVLQDSLSNVVAVLFVQSGSIIMNIF